MEIDPNINLNFIPTQTKDFNSISHNITPQDHKAHRKIGLVADFSMTWKLLKKLSEVNEDYEGVVKKLSPN